MKRNVTLTIAGSDSSGGAGIQADIKTILANGVYAESVITALTAQNTKGVNAIFDIPADFIEEQIKAVFEDIVPDSTKIGMVSQTKIIEIIAKNLKKYQAKKIVLDPVMVATSGNKLITDEAISSLTTLLFPIAELITPNIFEAEILSNSKIKNKEDMVQAATKIEKEFKVKVLLKGGHSINDANDLLVANGEATWFEGERIANPNTHGTGCSLSSAIAANLAKGDELKDAIYNAKKYLSNALKSKLDLGEGQGPIDHGYMI